MKFKSLILLVLLCSSACAAHRDGRVASAGERLQQAAPIPTTSPEPNSEVTPEKIEADKQTSKTIDAIDSVAANPSNPPTALVTPPTATPSASALSSEKSYILPAFEIIGFQLLLNLYNRNYDSSKEDYDTDLQTIDDNLHHGWGFDRDSFDINQLGHPYQGSIYYALARSAGLNFWESFGYTTVASAVWEVAGETTPPSLNDQITTSIGGSFLGEALFRTAETFRKSSREDDNAVPETTATIVSPASDFNRLAFDKKVTPDLDEQRTAVFKELQLGATTNNYALDTIESKSGDNTFGAANFAIDYGLPGKAGYEYEHPFDYFNLDFGMVTSGSDPVDHLLINGLLYGTKYSPSESARGIFGIYGSYNYLAPELFRVASTAFSLGTTGQVWLADRVALQGSLLGGIGFGAGGTDNATETGNDFHYGAVPQGILSLKLIMGNLAMLNISAQDFLVTGPSSDPSGDGNENIGRFQLALTTRVFGPHAVSVKYGQSHRDANFSEAPDQSQRVETIGVFYTYLFGGRLGAVNWDQYTAP